MRATPTMIGRAILRHLDVEGVDEVEVGYGFMPEYWGRGLATEIARACVRIGFDQLGLRSLVAITTPPNLASQRVMTKAGLVYERDIVHAGDPARAVPRSDATPSDPSGGRTHATRP